jgi:prepilin-type N-terminal cleavage/methylation domain-containing protein
MTGDQHQSRSGFTLIELLVVIALIAIISIIALPTVGSYFQITLSSATREIASTVKEAYNSTLLTGQVYRMAYDLKNRQYWVESGPANVLLETKESREKAEMKKRFTQTLSAQTKSQFSMATDINKKKHSLPRGVKFEDVITQESPEPIIDGMAYTHFFPNGLTEQTLIHLTDDSKHHTTLALTPILGRTDSYERSVTPEEAFGKK